MLVFLYSINTDGIFAFLLHARLYSRARDTAMNKTDRVTPIHVIVKERNE